MTEFSFLSVPMLLWSTHEHESLGGGRREDSLVVPFVSRVGTGVVPVAGSLMTDSERRKDQRSEQIFGWQYPPPGQDELTSNCFVSLQQSPPSDFLVTWEPSSCLPMFAWLKSNPNLVQKAPNTISLESNVLLDAIGYLKYTISQFPTCRRHT